MNAAAQPTNKDKIEQMCRNAGLRPEKRYALKNFDVLLADGFSLPPHIKFRRFGVTANEFPHGCYVTFWWLMKGEDRLFVANALMFDAFHNQELEFSMRKKARVNRALQEAAGFARKIEGRMVKKKRRVLHA